MTWKRNCKKKSHNRNQIILSVSLIFFQLFYNQLNLKSRMQRKGLILKMDVQDEVR